MLEILQTPITVLHITVAVFVVLIVLLQPGKSGGIGAALGGAGAQQVFGGRGAGNFLSRLTWISAGIFFATSMMLAYVSSSTDDSLAKHSNTAVVKPVELPEGNEAAAAQPEAPAEEAVMDGTVVEGAGGAQAEGTAAAEVGSEAQGTPDDAPAEEATPQAVPQKPPAAAARPKPPAQPAAQPPAAQPPAAQPPAAQPPAAQPPAAQPAPAAPPGSGP